MKNKERQNMGAKLKTSGLIPGMIAGLMIGLLTSLHYLEFIAWEVPYWRMIGGSLGGILLGLIVTVSLGKGFYWLKLLPKDQPYRFPGYALLITALLGWPVWDYLAETGFLWILLCFWIVLTLFLKLLPRWSKRTPFEKWEPRVIIGLLVCVLMLGLFLRFSGLTHGLPDYIVHCDTPKQLCLIPGFVEGNLIPPGRYPVGNIYLYSGVIRLWRSMIGTSGSIPELSHETMAEFAPYIITVRALQSLLSAAIPFFIFLIGRNLWGPWTGLIAAFLVACDPVHITYSRQEMGEIPQTFWVMVSFFFATRIFLNSKLRDCLLAGLFAGMAVATKMYGGYIILAAFAAILFSPSRFLRKMGLVLFGLILGIILGSPYLWVDPAGWWNDIFWETITELSVRAPGWNWSRLHSVQRGIMYLWQGLIHRFHLPWIILSLFGIGFLFGRHQRKDLFFLVPLLTSLVIIGFALSYLREWDFVNLTPYLAMAIAALSVHLLSRWGNSPTYRRLASLGLAVFLIFQGFVALSDAIIARFPDTRQLARQWVLRYVDRGSSFLSDAIVTGAAWIPVDSGLTLTDATGKKLLQDNNLSNLPPAQMALVERVWWDPPLSRSHYLPVQVIDLRSTFWENPQISLFRLDSPQSAPNLILPHTTIRSPEPAFLDGSGSQRQILDILSGSSSTRTQYLFKNEPINQMWFALLGQGRGSISFGPSLGFPAEVKMGKITSGLFTPVRQILPSYPRTYKVFLVPKPGKQTLWLGLYPRPDGMSPLLLRYEAWPELERMAGLGLTLKDAPAELFLFYAAALTAQGKNEKARQELDRLHQLHPQFLSLYQRLATGQEKNFNKSLGQMAQESLAGLSAEEVFWPNRPGDLGELDRLWPSPKFLSQDNLFHLWLPQTYLPGFLKAQVHFTLNGTSPAGNSRLIAIAFKSEYFLRELARIDLKPGLESLELPLQIPTGPVRLEFRIESSTPCQPKITSVQIRQDYESEFRWRWKVFSKYLKGFNLE